MPSRKMKNNNPFLWLCLVISVLFHIGILIFAPGLSLSALPEPRYTEVTLIPAISSFQSAPAKMKEPPIKPETLWAKGLELDVQETLERTKGTIIHLPEAFSLPSPEIDVDLSKLAEREEIFFPLAFPQELIGAEESRLLKKVEIPSRAKKEPVAEKPWEIRGPASKREVVFRPPPPSLQLKATAEIELKFWVLPNGAIGRVVPMRRGNPILEGEMMAYIKKWRFNPLPPNVPQKEQWGTIPIKYLLK